MYQSQGHLDGVSVTTIMVHGNLYTRYYWYKEHSLLNELLSFVVGRRIPVEHVVNVQQAEKYVSLRSKCTENSSRSILHCDAFVPTSVPRCFVCDLKRQLACLLSRHFS